MKAGRNTLIAVRLTTGQFWTAVRLGGGNTSKGVREALDRQRRRDVAARRRNAPPDLCGKPGDLGAPVGAQNGSARRTADPATLGGDAP
jgi:hypothetical protein